MPKTRILNQIEKIALKIVEVSQPEKIILFGSWAWGSPNENSDVDLCVIKRTSDTRLESKEIDKKIFPRQIPLDIVVYTPAYVDERSKLGDFFINDILNKGKVLYAGK